MIPASGQAGKLTRQPGLRRPRTRDARILADHGYTRRIVRNKHGTDERAYTEHTEEPALARVARLLMLKKAAGQLQRRADGQPEKAGSRRLLHEHPCSDRTAKVPDKHETVCPHRRWYSFVKGPRSDENAEDIAR